MGKSDTSVWAGLSSAPEASDSAKSSKGRLGVVKAGFRNGGAAAFGGTWGVKNDDWGGRALEGVPKFAKGFGLKLGFEGEEKTADETISYGIRSGIVCRESYRVSSSTAQLTILRITFGCMCKGTGRIKRAAVLVLPVHGTFVSSTIHNRLIATEQLELLRCRIFLDEWEGFFRCPGDFLVNESSCYRIHQLSIHP